MVCKICNQEKDDKNDFYSSNKHICKECIKKRSRENRLKNLEYYREYDRNRANKAERVKKQKEYKDRLRKENPEKFDKIYHSIRKNFRKKYPEKARANGIINDMLRSGKLIRPEFCSRCGKSCEPQAHHPDYSKPTEIVWLCVECYKTIHNELRMKQRKEAVNA